MSRSRSTVSSPRTSLPLPSTSYLLFCPTEDVQLCLGRQYRVELFHLLYQGGGLFLRLLAAWKVCYFLNF